MRAETIKALVVDDHPDAADTLSLIFAARGFTCRVAYDGVAAVEQAVQFHPDVVILDLRMPVMDGALAAVEIRRQLPEVRLIALTAHAGAEERQRISDAGFDALEHKPVEPEAFVRFVRRLLVEVRSRHEDTSSTPPHDGSPPAGADS